MLNPFDELDSPANEVLTPLDEKPVPNRFPSITGQPYKIAIIGEAPGRDEVSAGQPFVGMSGRFLSGWLSRAGIVRDACLIGNICQYRPPNNDIKSFAYDGDQIQSGLTQLQNDLQRFDPNICLLLGKTSLKAALGQDNISDWRGSLFVSQQPGPFYGRKCIASYHPAACLRQYEYTPLLYFDIVKTLKNSYNKTFLAPQRNLLTQLSLEETIGELEKIKRDKPLIGLDIEGYVDNMSCLSIAKSPTEAFIVPLAHRNGTNLYATLDDEVRIWKALSSVLEDPTIPKVLQNSLYDRFVLQYSYRIVVRGVIHDTMLRHWELYCELPKSLGFQCSIYTDEPFYKEDRETEDRQQFYQYCCKDSAVTHEINGKLSRMLDPIRDQHYRLNMRLLNPMLYMENKGIRYDELAAQDSLYAVEKSLYSLQSELDTIAGLGFNFLDPYRVTKAKEIMCYKRDQSQPKKEFIDSYPKVMEILTRQGDNFTPNEVGYVSSTLGLTMNMRSPMFKKFLYQTLNLPKQYKLNPKTDKETLTTNYEALLKIQKKQPHRAVELALDIGSLRTRSQMLHISADKDGRIRCGYNVVGTETGRITCYTSPTGSGYNLQTIPSKDKLKPEGHPLREGMRHLFLADEGYYLFQCDLSGADGWSVAAHLANLGDRTMLDDYLFGIKPAKVLCYLMRHGANSLAGKTRAEIKELTKEVKGEDWDYFASKIGQHGTCYLMGPRTMSNHIFIQSEGKILLSQGDTQNLQSLFMIRYRIKLWHDWMQRSLSKKAELQTASGARRRFFGRPQEILGEALASEPQFNTTFATNLAMDRLWNDSENRIIINGRVNLRVQPLHQVHDALLGQFLIKDEEWAKVKIKTWFNNTLVIANQKINIPYEGAYGSSWGNLDKGVL